jgi:hypothetical protein
MRTPVMLLNTLPAPEVHVMEVALWVFFFQQLVVFVNTLPEQA